MTFHTLNQSKNILLEPRELSIYMQIHKTSFVKK
jgi:hypothetical protein